MDKKQLSNQLCLVSKNGACLLDMQQVAQAAEALGLTHLAELVRTDLETNQITTGNYYPLVAELYGVRS